MRGHPKGRRPSCRHCDMWELYRLNWEHEKQRDRRYIGSREWMEKYQWEKPSAD